MRYFFIDLENVRSEGLEGVLSLNSDDMVYIFYSENAMNLSIPALENLNNSKAATKFIKTNYIGKNAMDFQIVSLFGAMIERCRKGSYYIISQDNGFRSAVSFCESFFADYDILCGVYPRIIAAITDELKKTSKSAAKQNKKAAKDAVKEPEKAVAKEPDTDDEAKAENMLEGEHKKSRRSRHRKDKKNVFGGDNAETMQEMSEEPNEQVGEAKRAEETQDASQMPAADTTAGDKPSKKKRRKHRSKDKGAVAAENEPDGSESGDEPEVVENTVPVQNRPQETGRQGTDDAGNRKGRLVYIYDTLKELLSEKTIDIYAAAIDEGIATSKNKDELHVFFKERYGEDEGEALYRVTQGDFDLMKQRRPKRSSGSRRRSGKNRSAGSQTVS